MWRLENSDSTHKCRKMKWVCVLRSHEVSTSAIIECHHIAKVMMIEQTKERKGEEKPAQLKRMEYAKEKLLRDYLLYLLKNSSAPQSQPGKNLSFERQRNDAIK